MKEATRWRLACWGAFLLLLGVYLFTHPGRIDITDGQQRFDVAANIVNLHGPILTDANFVDHSPRNAKTGWCYSFYNAPASVIAVPVMIVNRVTHTPSLASDRWAFSLTSVWFGALVGPLLLAFYRRLGVALLPAVASVGIFCFTTLWWPGSNTTFDQVQHGVVLLAATLLAWEAGRERSVAKALGAGLLMGLLVNYRESFIINVPGVALAFMSSGGKADRKIVLKQLGALGVGVAIGIAGYFYYNWIRFDQLNRPAYADSTPLFGNPLSGFLTLAISPGKGFFWYSPSIIFCAWGVAALKAQEPSLVRSITVNSIVHIGLTSCLSFAGGDWCWGPRYLLVVMPLWALFLPYALQTKFFKRLGVFVCMLGFLVQGLAASLDIHRFFYYHRLPDRFWLDDWTYYFEISQLFARPAEILQSIEERDRVRPIINSAPSGEATYCPFGPAYLTDRREWQKDVKLFYLPKPFWGWNDAVPPRQRPIGTLPVLFSCAIFVAVGGTLLVVATDRRYAAKEPQSV